MDNWNEQAAKDAARVFYKTVCFDVLIGEAKRCRELSQQVERHREVLDRLVKIGSAEQCSGCEGYHVAEDHVWTCQICDTTGCTTCSDFGVSFKYCDNCVDVVCEDCYSDHTCWVCAASQTLCVSCTTRTSSGPEKSTAFCKSCAQFACEDCSTWCLNCRTWMCVTCHDTHRCGGSGGMQLRKRYRKTYN